jgi:hypothetical protein
MTGTIKVSVIFMNTTQILQQLLIVYTLLKDTKTSEAKNAFLALKIVDTKEHLSFPTNIRHLIWNLHEYLVLDNTRYTDLTEIMDGFADIFLKK